MPFGVIGVKLFICSFLVFLFHRPHFRIDGIIIGECRLPYFNCLAILSAPIQVIVAKTTDDVRRGGIESIITIAEIIIILINPIIEILAWLPVGKSGTGLSQSLSGSFRKLVCRHRPELPKSSAPRLMRYCS
jgi:hypothetical protein